MSVLVLAIEKPYWQDVMLKCAELGLRVSAAVVHYRDPGKPNQFFDKHQVKQVNGKAFYRIEDLSKQIISDFGNEFPALDASVLDALEIAERDFYNLTDRFSYFPKTFRYRKRLWRESIRYWLAFFANNKIEALFLGCTPHNLADYTCFHVAKYLGIRTLLTGHTMINDYVIMRNDYREIEKMPDGYVAGDINAHLRQAALEESGVLKIVVQANDAKTGAKNVKAIKKEVNWSKVLRQVNRYLFKSTKFTSSLAMNDNNNAFIRRSIKRYSYFDYKQRQKAHDELAHTPDLSAKYIYFAMHLQPERTSTPEAELFEDQLLAINILAKALPEGWKLYVKENPRQFSKVNYIKGRHQRDISDYQDILKLPNVQLIDQKVPSREIVNNAQAVATLAGSVGWEGLLAGKKVIIFAHAWYAACPSAYRVDNVESAKAAIAKPSTPEIVQDDVLRYLSFMQDKLTIGNMGTPTYLRAAKFSYNEIVERMATRIAKDLL